MAIVTEQALLESGSHFGHRPSQWNPKMAKYIFQKRGDVHIIDLKKIKTGIEKAYKAIYDVVYNDGEMDGKVLFVGTKTHANTYVKEEAERTGQYYVSHRWLGGTLTNFKTIRKSVKYLIELEELEASGGFEKLTKKEVLLLRHKMERLTNDLSGIKAMDKLPNLVFVIDPNEEINAVKEARRLHIPVVGVVDTNCDPDLVDYVIPSNDDAIKAVRLVTHLMGNAVYEALGNEVEKYEDEVPGEKAASSTPKLEQKEAQKEEVVQEEVAVEEVVAVEPAPAKKGAKAKKEVKIEEPIAPAAQEEVVEEVSLKPLTEYTLVQLKAIAKEKGLKGYSALKKDELIELISK
ncbi:MAG: 30S ribosomal protein S2 [Acholeplasmatales bacterium]|nr:30S ribosomal protein S2 [Acholeplasmatales bacterium]